MAPKLTRLKKLSALDKDIDGLLKRYIRQMDKGHSLRDCNLNHCCYACERWLARAIKKLVEKKVDAQIAEMMFTKDPADYDRLGRD